MEEDVEGESLYSGGGGDGGVGNFVVCWLVFTGVNNPIFGMMELVFWYWVHVSVVLVVLGMVVVVVVVGGHDTALGHVEG